jgi:hypothetical protein
MSVTATRTRTHYEPPGLRVLVEAITYKPGWVFELNHEVEDDGSGGLRFEVVSDTENSIDPERRIRVRVWHVGDHETARKRAGDA